MLMWRKANTSFIGWHTKPDDSYTLTVVDTDGAWRWDVWFGSQRMCYGVEVSAHKAKLTARRMYNVLKGG